jgi:hypothetical protein
MLRARWGSEHLYPCITQIIVPLHSSRRKCESQGITKRRRKEAEEPSIDTRQHRLTYLTFADSSLILESSPSTFASITALASSLLSSAYEATAAWDKKQCHQTGHKEAAMKTASW